MSEDQQQQFIEICNKFTNLYSGNKLISRDLFSCGLLVSVNLVSDINLLITLFQFILKPEKKFFEIIDGQFHITEEMYQIIKNGLLSITEAQEKQINAMFNQMKSWRIENYNLKFCCLRPVYVPEKTALMLQITTVDSSLASAIDSAINCSQRFLYDEISKKLGQDFKEDYKVRSKLTTELDSKFCKDYAELVKLTDEELGRKILFGYIPYPSRALISLNDDVSLVEKYKNFETVLNSVLSKLDMTEKDKKYPAVVAVDLRCSSGLTLRNSSQGYLSISGNEFSNITDIFQYILQTTERLFECGDIKQLEVAEPLSKLLNSKSPIVLSSKQISDIDAAILQIKKWHLENPTCKYIEPVICYDPEKQSIVLQYVNSDLIGKYEFMWEVRRDPNLPEIAILNQMGEKFLDLFNERNESVKKGLKEHSEFVSKFSAIAKLTNTEIGLKVLNREIPYPSGAEIKVEPPRALVAGAIKMTVLPPPKDTTPEGAGTDLVRTTRTGVETVVKAV